jgi:signal transduction histidine kinase
MGSRSRSVRLRIYFLVAIPLVAMAGLLAYVAGTSVRNAVNLDRAPDLINATSLPTAAFTGYLQAERAAAVSYLFAPGPARLAAYQAAVAATSQHAPAFRTAMTSAATVGSETPAEASAIKSALANLGQLTSLRAAVTARAIIPIVALTDYSRGIAAEPALFLTEADSETDANAVGQALGLIATVQAREQLSQEWALVGGMLAGNRMSRADRITIAGTAATRQADLSFAQSILTPANLVIYDAGQNGSAAAQQQLTVVEQALAGGTEIGQLPITQAQWQQAAGTLLQDDYNSGLLLASAELVSDHQFSRSAWTRVAVTSGIALLGLLVTIVMSTLVARGIIRRLRGLERSALTVAEQQLPDVIARLRRGEDVDVAQEAPPLQAGPDGADEISRVGRSFDLVRQTAIRSAVEEARLRRGLNDVFRSLARRSQSLLHRQLALLDQMERRATDPEALDDLFRLDHLTTRMRRHAEGLVILAGATPSRGWNSPVRMVDVMRGAIAEVEDYARVAVATQSQAALSGPAVADVIHLLAELIENATTLSPPYTSVRVTGDAAAHGFAIEVEDRGLGMSQERQAEFNERLARAPEFNPADSEQLGLFVVSQLARRHSIQVTLKTSPYGGITAVVLIPQDLVVTEAAFQAVPEPAALPPAPRAIEAPAEPAFDVFKPWPRGQHLVPAADPEPQPPAPEPLDADPFGADPVGADPVGADPAGADPAGAEPAGAEPAGAEPLEAGALGAELLDAGALDLRGSYLPSPPAGLLAGPGSRPYPDPGPPPVPGSAPATPMTSVAPAPPDRVSAPPWELSGQTGPLPVLPDGPEPAGSGRLPHRVRQASLAPQLRSGPPVPSGPSRERSPAEIRQAMSALQRGWQKGRETEARDGDTDGT